jgi:hypothetical protein
VDLIEKTEEKGLVAGKDLGIISYNDTPLKKTDENKKHNDWQLAIPAGIQWAKNQLQI